MMKERKVLLLIAMLMASGCGGVSSSSLSDSVHESIASMGMSSSSSSTESSSSTAAHSSSVSSTSVGSSFVLPEIDGSDLPQSVKNYYSGINFSQSGAALKTSLHNKINSHKSLGYNNLNGYYPQTDAREDGTIWDMYSNVRWNFNTKVCGNYKNEGDCWNKEHSIPQSWFNEQSTMKCDIFHVYPTDGKVNGMRSNYPFGEVGKATYTSQNGSKRGNSSFPGYSGIVFEPIDEYKGDFARTYFYFATCYQKNSITNGKEAQVAFQSGTYPTLTQYSINLFLKWSEMDPVSEKEINRNNAAYACQQNRNPFIDFPNLEQRIWGMLRK